VAKIFRTSAGYKVGKDNKELPQNFGKAKVREFGYCKNFEREFYLVNQ